jgi:hypothetical protein
MFYYDLRLDVQISDVQILDERIPFRLIIGKNSIEV